ncbi:hypothetical protein B0H66DRAFT_350401 [Apodospora peruviana]|uniref:Uncharacterized protein n=1 Tax=Apodospora peruviana TaxID=516989 RepID=A0AAE0HWS2_9PEZI|nr:hypothetical protein B0H66DRAFT_350401 [Apodospora peruviana]
MAERGCGDNHSRRPSYGVLGSVNGTPVHATIASETRHNIVSARAAEEYGLKITPFRHRYSQLGRIDETGTESVGKAKGTWRFDKEVKEGGGRNIEFTVLAETSRPIVLGSDFSMQTNTLTEMNRHYIAPPDPGGRPEYCVHLFDKPPRLLAGILNKQPILAVPATGADANIISSAFVDRHKLWNKVTIPSSQHSSSPPAIRLSNNKLVRSVGCISLPWGFEVDRKSGVRTGWPFWVILDFFVLPGLGPYDAVLGQEVLFDFDVFIKHEDSFKYVDEPPLPPSLRAGVSGRSALPFILSGLFQPRGAGFRSNLVPTAGSGSVLEELQRRANFDREHSTGNRYNPGAWEAEQDRRAKWNTRGEKIQQDGQPVGGAAKNNAEGSQTRSGGGESSSDAGSTSSESRSGSRTWWGDSDVDDGD